jgi:hypothetical protein
MFTPKVKFINITLLKEVDWMHSFLIQDNWGWDKYIIKKHPKIKEVFSFKNEKEKVKFLKGYIFETREENQKIINKNKVRYEKNWRKTEKDFFILLSEILQITWPLNRDIIKAMISINPICPRFLNDWSFFIYFNYKNIKDAMEIIMHECCHFLYFEKWKNMHPKMNSEKFEFPYIEWHLSEIIAPIVLNDSRIQKLLKKKAVFYTEHRKIKIGGKTVPKYFTDLYNKITKNDNFEDFLKESYQVIKVHKKLFKEIKI